MIDLLLFAELVFIVKELQTVEDVLHSDQWVSKKLLKTQHFKFRVIAQK